MIPKMMVWNTYEAALTSEAAAKRDMMESFMASEYGKWAR
jgi:hypothetical protein